MRALSVCVCMYDLSVCAYDLTACVHVGICVWIHGLTGIELTCHITLVSGVQYTGHSNSVRHPVLILSAPLTPITCFPHLPSGAHQFILCKVLWVRKWGRWWGRKAAGCENPHWEAGCGVRWPAAGVGDSRGCACPCFPCQAFPAPAAPPSTLGESRTSPKYRKWYSLIS